MSIIENKALVEKYFSSDTHLIHQEFKRSQLDFHALELVVHSQMGEMNLDKLWQAMNPMIEAFPDRRYSPEDIIAEGDKVICRYQMKGTDQGTFKRVLPARYQVSIEGIVILRIQDGKIVEMWFASDALEMLHRMEKQLNSAMIMSRLGFLPPEY